MEQRASSLEALGWLGHSRTNAFRRAVEQAQRVIDEAPVTSWYCSFSGGSDSLVLLDLLHRSGLAPDVVWGDDGADYPETLDCLAAVERDYGLRVWRVQCLEPWSDWCRELGRADLAAPPVTQEVLDAWLNPHAWSATWPSLRSGSRQAGFGGVFLGLLAAESAGRRRMLRGGKRPLYQVTSEGTMWHCSPLASWDKLDIWGYIAWRGLPYNPVYARLAGFGIPLEQRRIAPLTCFRVMQYGSHAWLRMGWPDLFERLAATFPAIRRAT